MDLATARRIIVMFVGMIMLAAGMTMLFLGMRAVMDVGGMCASGGPYVVAQPCPEGTAALMPLGIVGGLIGLAMYTVSAAKLPGPRLSVFAWSALFLSLGWNFWEYGLNPPEGSEGPVWGWIVCGVLFVMMGALPLLILRDRRLTRHLLWGDPQSRPPQPSVRPTRLIPQPPTSTTQPSVSHSLQQLADLHSRGALTDEEFAAAKQRILGDR